MKLRHLGAFCACIFSLSISSAVNAAFYDFNQWVNDNGEQGFDNSNPFQLTDDGLQLTAKAFSRPSNSARHVYLDNLLDGSGTLGGMGVCRSGLDVANQCTGNPAVERDKRERLSWNFSEDISSITLEMTNVTNEFIIKSLNINTMATPG